MTALASVADFSTVAASADAPLLFGSLQIDPQRRLVWQSGQMVDLTPMEFDILLLLARRPGQVFTARQIYEAVATDSFDAGWTGISSMVYKLRRKLGADIIETRPGPRLPLHTKITEQRRLGSTGAALLLFCKGFSPQLLHGADRRSLLPTFHFSLPA